MNATETTPPMLQEPEADDAWRGVVSEDTEDLSAAVGQKLQARSRRLLRTLIRPRRGPALLAAFVVVLSEAAYLLGPLVVAYGIDTAVPALVAGDAGPLVFATLADNRTKTALPAALTMPDPR